MKKRLQLVTEFLLMHLQKNIKKNLISLSFVLMIM